MKVMMMTMNDPHINAGKFEFVWDKIHAQMVNGRLYQTGRGQALINKSYQPDKLTRYPVGIVPITSEFIDDVKNHIDDQVVLDRLEKSPQLIFKIIDEIIVRATQRQAIIDEINYFDTDELRDIIKHK